MIFKTRMDTGDTDTYRQWLKDNCGEEGKAWIFNYWKFDYIYGVTIHDMEVETLFRLRFEL